MKKETLICIILGTAGGLLFSLGMCMCLLPQWGLFTPGVVFTALGLAILLPIYPIYRKAHPRPPVHVKKRTLTAIACGVGGCALLGLGMSIALLCASSRILLLCGILVGVLGILVLALIYPIYLYCSDPK